LHVYTNVHVQFFHIIMSCVIMNQINVFTYYQQQCDVITMNHTFTLTRTQQN
jgi:hypothetical protein